MSRPSSTIGTACLERARSPARGRATAKCSHGCARLASSSGSAWNRQAVAKRALADVGLDGDEAALDIRDLRSLVDCIRLVRRTAMQTAVRMITTGVILALLAGIAIKLKIFGGSP